MKGTYQVVEPRIAIDFFERDSAIEELVGVEVTQSIEESVRTMTTLHDVSSRDTAWIDQDPSPMQAILLASQVAVLFSIGRLTEYSVDVVTGLELYSTGGIAGRRLNCRLGSPGIAF